MSSTCQDCYSTTTPNPCDKIGCLETTYGKCVKYSGDPLYCGRGPIAGFTLSGVAVVPASNPVVYSGISGQENRGGVLTYTVTGTASGLTSNGNFGPYYPTSTNGSGAAFNVVISGGSINNSTGVVLALAGSEYNVGDALSLPGTLLPGGTSGDNLTITVNTVSKKATFKITRTPGSSQYTVEIVDASNNYLIGETILIKGSVLGGLDGTNDLTITVTSIKAQINTLDNLDAVIKNINSRLCSLFGSFSDYSAFNFSCLRVGGGLGTGTSIQNEQQFVEAASAAVCSIDARVLALEKPAMTVPACLTLTSGTSTLSQILTEIADKLCIAYNQSGVITGITTPTACVSDFSAQPGSGTATATQWINWILTNICSIKTALRTDVDAHEVRLDDLDNLIGTVYTKFDNSAAPFSSGGHGGTTNQDMRTTVGVIKNVISTFNGYFTAMGANLRANSFAVSQWSTCYTGIGASTSAASLETQLGWIVSALKLSNYTFNAAHFVVTPASCGPSISVNPAIMFSASMLNTVSINELADVIVTSPTDPSVLYWNGSAWIDAPADDLIKAQSADGSVNITKTVTPGEVLYDFSVAALTPAAYQLNPATILNANNLVSTDFPVTGATYLRVIKQGGICTFEGSALIVSTGTFSTTANTDFVISSAIPSAVRPARNQYAGFSVIKRNSSAVPTAIYYGVVTITPAGDVKVRLMEPVTTSTVHSLGEELELVLGGISYSLV